MYDLPESVLASDPVLARIRARVAELEDELAALDAEACARELELRAERTFTL